MSNAVWVNNRQPQTLYIAQILMYFQGVMAILFGTLFSFGSVELFGSTLIGGIYILGLTVGLVAAAYGIANEHKWGYQLGIASAFAPFLVRLQLLFSFNIAEAIGFNTIGLLFDIALIALLFHPMSKNYQKVWFR